MGEQAQGGALPVGLGLMCKAPRVGLAKTRLAASVGAERAAELARAFIADAVATLRQAAALHPCGLHVFYAPDDAAPDVRAFVPEDIPLHAQDPRGLGAAMFSALRMMLARHPAGALVIGSDLPTLPPDIIAQAMAHLRAITQSVVIGPAEDGGYYLIGIKSERAAPLFAPMAWSTPQVLAETRARAAAQGLGVVELPAWYDVDDAASLARLTRDLQDGRVPPGTARATRAALGL
jgi:rSAM/selenodomain-associated transferase 1